MLEKLKCLSRNQLKWIAIFLMFCDHFAVAFVSPESPVYFVLRYVLGRSAFPIFCVLFVQGFFYTKRPLRHIIDCGIFALLSEIPFDIVCGKQTMFPFMDWNYQNVMFTWFLGFLMCYLLDKLFDIQDDMVSEFVRILLSVGIVFCFACIASVFSVDYQYVGIFCIYAVYLMMKLKTKSAPIWLLGAVVALLDGFASWTIWTFPAVLLLACYDSNKYKKQNVVQKYGFYLFYPLHLAVFSIILLMKI